MLPLSLLNAAQDQPMLVELKSGETLNGHLINCDTWMNLTLSNVIQTSPDGERFVKLPEAYVRGNLIKYVRVPDELLTEIKEERVQRNAAKERERQQTSSGNRGGRGGGYRERGGRGGRGGSQRNGYKKRD